MTCSQLEVPACRYILKVFLIWKVLSYIFLFFYSGFLKGEIKHAKYQNICGEILPNDYTEKIQWYTAVLTKLLRIKYSLTAFFFSTIVHSKLWCMDMP